ncbi:MAG TPA: helix-turn-helix domain-containing protein [Ktedonobacterales bacterium]|nr:helix-turn-helix domain-containing protein [Ktedonobacterales bacterium]
MNSLRTTTPRAVLMTFREAMDFLRVSRSTIYRLMWSGQLRGHKVGNTWRFYESDLVALVGEADIQRPFALQESDERA